MYFIIALLDFNVLRNHRILSEKKMKPCCVLGKCNVGDYLGHNYVLVDSVCFILWLITVSHYEMLIN